MINEKNVFINCPFDNEYFILLKPLLFTIVYVDLNPQICETSDSGENRLQKINNLMSISKFSIHDLSRVEKIKGKRYPRFNMPFECGIDFGLKMSLFPEKKFLILEKEQYRYKEIISDISGNDIGSHKEDPEQLIKVIRDWFRKLNIKVPGYKSIWYSYNEFNEDFIRILKNNDNNPNNIHELPFVEIIEIITSWVSTWKSKNNISF